MVARRVAGCVGDDAVEPGRGHRVARAGERREGREEGVLGQVLGLCGVADEAVDVAVDRPLIADEELVDGRL